MNPLMKYPVFVTEQVLTAKNLNDIVEYLNEQDLSTRRNLIGIGIACGLTVSSDQKTNVKISCGCGVTSLGLLINIPEQDLYYYRKYTDLATVHYSKFIKSGTTQYDLWELLTQTEYEEADDPANDHKIDGNADFILKDMVVLLYLELIDKDLDNCIDEGCDEKGIARLFNLRKLLIKRTDLLTILRKGIITTYNTVPGESDLFKKIYPACSLDPVMPHRLKYSLSDLTSLNLSYINSWTRLKNSFLEVIKADVISISNILYKSYQVYSNELLNLYPSGNPFTGFNNNSVSSNQLYQLIESQINENDFNIQYAYDFIWDLVKAYDEFLETAAIYRSKCCINTDLFPYHLMLGVVAKNARKLDKIYRHHWQPSPAVSSMNDVLEKLRFLHYKIYQLIVNFNLRSLPNLEDIIITPGKFSGWPFSSHSMAHYYSDGTSGIMHEYWNYDFNKNCKENTVLSYFPSLYSSLPFVLHPLLYSLRDYEYFRIEGHIGQEYKSVRSKLQQLIKDFNLPFDIFGIKLSSDRLDVEVEDHCFSDIQTVYKCNRDEYIACVKTLSRLIDAFINAINALKKQYPNILNYSFSTANNQLPFISTLQQLFVILQIYASYLKKIQVQLPEHIKDFKYDEFKVSYFIVFAFSLFYEIYLEYLSNLQKEFSAAFLQVMLLKTLFERLLDDCMEAKFKSLYDMYRERLVKMQLGRLFPGYVEGSPGMEHIAGVKEGGTFILVYDVMPNVQPDQPFEPTEPQPFDPCFELEEAQQLHLNVLQYAYVVSQEPILIEEFKERINPSAARNVNKDIKNENFTTNTGKVNFDTSNNFEFQQSSYTHNRVMQLQQQFSTSKAFLDHLFEKGEDLRPIKKSYRVVADFAVPFRCCSSCLQIDELPSPDLSLQLDPSEFCFNDDKRYPVRIDPTGGELVSSGGGIVKEGENYYFVPANTTGSDETITLTYTIDDQSVQKSVMVYHPVADFDVEYYNDLTSRNDLTRRVSLISAGDLTHGSDLTRRKYLVLRNKSVNADTYQWTIQEIAHYVSTEKDVTIYYDTLDINTLHVTLQAYRKSCKAIPVTKEITIEQQPPQEVIVNLKYDKYCSDDNQAYPFFLSPEGGKLTPESQYFTDGNNKPVFMPSKATEKQITFEYDVNGIKDTFAVTLIEVKAKILEVGRTAETVTLKSNSVGARNLQWYVNGSPRNTTNEQQIKKGEFVNNRAQVKLVALAEPCTSADEVEVIWEQSQIILFDLQKPKYNNDYIYCNNDRENYLFTASPEGVAVEGIGVTKRTDGNYYFTPLNLNEGGYVFKFRGKELNVTLAKALSISFSYDVGAYDENSHTIRVYFIYDQYASGIAIDWVFGDNTSIEGSSLRVIEKIFDLTNQQKFLVRIFGRTSQNCTSIYEEELDLSRYTETNNPSVGTLTVTEYGALGLANLSADARVSRLTNYNLSASSDLLTYHLALKKSIATDTSKKEAFLNGSMNAAIAKEYNTALADIKAAVIKAKEKGDEDIINYLMKMYLGSLQQLVATIGALDKEPAKNSTLYKSLASSASHLKELKDLSIDINPDGSLKAIVEKSLSRLSAKKNVSEIVTTLGKLM